MMLFLHHPLFRALQCPLGFNTDLIKLCESYTTNHFCPLCKQLYPISLDRCLCQLSMFQSCIAHISTRFEIRPIRPSRVANFKTYRFRTQDGQELWKYFKNFSENRQKVPEFHVEKLFRSRVQTPIQIKITLSWHQDLHIWIC